MEEYNNLKLSTKNLIVRLINEGCNLSREEIIKAAKEIESEELRQSLESPEKLNISRSASNQPLSKKKKTTA